MRTKAQLKRVQAVDNNFLVQPEKLLNFNRFIQIIARMFYIPSRKLNNSYLISDLRWKQIKHKYGRIMDFYNQELSNCPQKLPKIYKLDIEQRIIRPRCYCLDISQTIFKDGQLVLWKCNSCKKYLAYLSSQVKHPLNAYQVL